MVLPLEPIQPALANIKTGPTPTRRRRRRRGLISRSRHIRRERGAHKRTKRDKSSWPLFHCSDPQSLRHPPNFKDLIAATLPLSNYDGVTILWKSPVICAHYGKFPENREHVSNKVSKVSGSRMIGLSSHLPVLRAFRPSFFPSYRYLCSIHSVNS
jgi:hypothetical protein